MFKKLLTILFLNFVIITYAQSWTQLTDFSGSARDDGATFVLNNKAYCFTGVSSSCTGDGFIFDAGTETWSPMASLPIGNERQYAAAFSYSNTGYMMGGINCSNVRLNDFWQYSPISNTWAALPNFPSTGRYGTSNFIIKNKVYVIGGTLANNTLSNQVWEYNFTTTTWTQKNNLPFNAMHRGSAFAIDTLGYVCYGVDNNSAFNHYIYSYNYVNDTWRRVSNLTLPAKFYIGTAVCNNKAALYGGQDSVGTISNNYTIFNPADSSLTNLAGIPTIGRKGAMAFSINNVFYITTGYSTASVRIKETWKNTALVGVKELLTKDGKLKIYPNPINEILNIELSIENITLKIENIQLSIINSLGEVIQTSTILYPTTQLNVNDLKCGIYFLKIYNNQQLISTQKIIKN